MKKKRDNERTRSSESNQMKQTFLGHEFSQGLDFALEFLNLLNHLSLIRGSSATIS